MVIQEDVIGNDLLFGEHEQRMPRLPQPHTAVLIE